MSRITSETLASFLREHRLVLLDFVAEWCGPCRIMKPVLKQLVATNPDIQIAEINIDDEPDLATDYSVRSVPNFHLILNGKDIGTTIGSQSLSQMQAWIQKQFSTVASAR